MVKAFNRPVTPKARIRVEDGVEKGEAIHFAVSCRHCETPYCVKGCITGALSVSPTGVIKIDENRCVGCRTCVALCPYGCLVMGPTKTMLKCELCVDNAAGEPACVTHCPNRAIVFEERGE